MGRGRSGIGKGGGGGGFHTFKDSGTEDEWHFRGDGAEVTDFFMNNSNFDQLLDGMSDDEKYQFRRWVSGHFMSGQQYRGFDNMDLDDQAMTRTYDKILDQATLDRGIEVRRLSTAELVLGAGRRRATLAELQAMEGRDINYISREYVNGGGKSGVRHRV